jgi:hypothetical protein
VISQEGKKKQSGKENSGLTDNIYI